MWNLHFHSNIIIFNYIETKSIKNMQRSSHLYQTTTKYTFQPLLTYIYIKMHSLYILYNNKSMLYSSHLSAISTNLWTKWHIFYFLSLFYNPILFILMTQVKDVHFFAYVNDNTDFPNNPRKWKNTVGQSMPDRLNIQKVVGNTTAMSVCHMLTSLANLKTHISANNRLATLKNIIVT